MAYKSIFSTPRKKATGYKSIFDKQEEVEEPKSTGPYRTFKSTVKNTDPFSYEVAKPLLTSKIKDKDIKNVLNYYKPGPRVLPRETERKFLTPTTGETLSAKRFSGVNTPEQQEQLKLAGERLATQNIPAEEFFRKGLSFGHNIPYADPVPRYDPVTKKQALAEGAGKLATMLLITKLGTPVVGGALNKIPGLAGPLSKLSLAAKTSPWKIGYPLNVLKSGGLGAFFGALEQADTKKEMAKNVYETAGTFAAFSAIAYPVQRFFSDTYSSLSKQERLLINNKVKNTFKGSPDTGALLTNPKEVYFRSESNPNNIIKVTSKEIHILSAGEVPSATAKSAPLFRQENIEVFRKDKALYKTLLNWLSKDIKSTAPKGYSFSKGIMKEIGSDIGKYNTVSTSGIPSVVAKPVIGTIADLKKEIAPKEGTPIAELKKELAPKTDNSLNAFKKEIGYVEPKKEIEEDISVFHGTDTDFENFESKFLGSANGTAPINKTGFSFTSDKNVAKTFGKNIIEAKVDIQNPMIIDAKGKDYSEFKDTLNQQLENIDKDKYDGIIIKNYKDAGVYGQPTISDHYIPFSEKQIKTVKPATKTTDLELEAKKAVEQGMSKEEFVGETIVDNPKKIISLVLDGEVGKLFETGSDESMGAMVFNSNLKKHFEKHIQSFYGKTMFDSSTGQEKISKLLDKKLTYFMRRFDSPAERVGAEKMFEHIKKEFNNLPTKSQLEQIYNKAIEESSTTTAKQAVGKKETKIADKKEVKDTISNGEIEARKQSVATEKLKADNKISPDDTNYWATPIEGEPKTQIPTQTDSNGIQIEDGDVIEFSAQLDENKKGRTTIRWNKPYIANASGKRVEGGWVGNGSLPNKIPFTIVERGGKAITTKQLTDIYNKAKPTTAKQAVGKKELPKVEKVEVKEIKSTELETKKAFSRHYERMKDINPILDGDGIEIGKESQKKELDWARNYIQRNPQSAIQMAYGTKPILAGHNKQILSGAVYASLKAEGNIELADEIAKKISLRLTEAARTMAAAKMDLHPAEKPQIESKITEERLKALGKKLGETDPNKMVEKAKEYTRSKTKKITKNVKTEQAKTTTEQLQEVDDLINSLLC